MVSLYVQELRDFTNISNQTVLFTDEYELTTDTNLRAPEESSLQTTRFVVQGILTPAIVTIGLLGNFLNIIVLIQPSMRTSTNIYLLVLSVADSVFLAFNFALSLLDCGKRGLSESAYYFNPFGRFLSNYSGNVGVWVTVVFTVERYIAVRHPMQGKVWCTVSRAQMASIAVVILALVNTIPTLFEIEVINTSTGHRCTPTQFSKSFSYEIGYSWWYVLVFTFIPFICLTIFNCVLIRTLFVASRKRQQLSLISTTVIKHADSSNGKSKMYHQHIVPDNISGAQMSDRSSTTSISTSYSVRGKQPRPAKRFSREQNKVTIMLITIVMIFLLCQVPWTALFLYQTYLSSQNLAPSLTALKIAGNICNALQLVNASVNFYLYSFFSKRFRHTLARLTLFWRRSQSSSPTTV